MDTVSYIVGDIHGQARKLERLLANIESRHHWKSPGKGGKIIYLGDYIDRGPDSLRVIDLAMSGIKGFSSVFLKGNHEQLLQDVLRSSERHVWNTWLSAGGEATLRSFGYNLFQNQFDPAHLRDLLGEPRVAWLEGLELRHQFEDMICVHAGFCPHVPIAKQVEKDMLWIRKRFLNSNYDFGLGVIHGHTPHDAPVVKFNRICIDTGAGMGGDLTALIVDKSWDDLVKDPDFIVVS